MHRYTTHSRFTLWKHKAVVIKEQNPTICSNTKDIYNKKLKAVEQDIQYQPILVSLGCHNKSSQIWWLLAEIYSSQFLGDRIPKSKCRQGPTPSLKAIEKNPSLPLPVSVDSKCPLAYRLLNFSLCLQFHITSPCLLSSHRLLLCILSSLPRTLPLNLLPTLTQSDLTLRS